MAGENFSRYTRQNFTLLVAGLSVTAVAWASEPENGPPIFAQLAPPKECAALTPRQSAPPFGPGALVLIN